jgi:hypothetical protein
VNLVDVIENVVVVGDKNVVRDLFHPEVTSKNGRPRLRALIAPGGAKSGVTMGQRLCAFESLGIDADRFDAGLATSAGAYNVVAYCAKQARHVPALYEKVSWLNPKVLQSILTRRDYLGFQYLRDEVEKLLDVDTFRKCRMDLSIGVSDLKGNVHLHKAKEAENICDLVYASAALFPVVPGKIIKNVYSVDGGYSRQSSVIKWIRQKLHEIPRDQGIDLLYLANRPHPKLHFSKREEKIFNKFVDYTLSGYPELAEGARSIDKKLLRVTEVFEDSHPRIHPNVRMCALFTMPDENIYPNEWRKKILRSRGELTRRRTEAFLKALQPAREV